MEAPFVVKFVDDKLYNGDLFKQEWSKLPEKEIQCVVFSFGGQTVKMQDYEFYVITYETISLVGGKTAIANIQLCGRKKETSDIIIFDMKSKKVFKKEVEKYTEYGNQIISNWKEGIKEGNPQIYKTVTKGDLK